MAFESRQCVICGATFVPNNKTQQCCGIKCAREKTKQTLRRTMVCAYCGKEFWRRVSHPVKYCSEECRKADVHSRPQKERPKREYIIYEKECRYCGQAFQTNLKQKLYCCDECAYQGGLLLHRIQWKEQYQPKKRICKVCGTEWMSRCGDKHSVYCCDDCAQRAERIKEHRTEATKKIVRFEARNGTN